MREALREMRERMVQEHRPRPTAGPRDYGVCGEGASLAADDRIWARPHVWGGFNDKIERGRDGEPYGSALHRDYNGKWVH